jgi:hypothetical protein
VSTQNAKSSNSIDFFENQTPAVHKEAVNLDGFDHVFKWATEPVEAEDERVRQARDKRVRRQVLDVLEEYKEQKILARSQDEVAYLQRRVIALLAKLQELTEETAAVKQIMVSQFWAIQRIPFLEEQIRALKAVEYEKEAAVKERRYLMDALAKLKVERDYLEDILVTVEDENTKLSNILSHTREEVEILKERKWWQMIFPKNWYKQLTKFGIPTR